MEFAPVSGYFGFPLDGRSYSLLLAWEEAGLLWKFENAFRDAGKTYYMRNGNADEFVSTVIEGNGFVALLKLVAICVAASVIAFIAEILWVRGFWSNLY